MDVVSGFSDRRLGYDEINKTRDYLAARAPRQARGQFSTGQLGPGFARTVNVAFPADTFTVPPIVLVSSTASRVNASVSSVTTTGCVLSFANWTDGNAAAFTAQWLAVEA